MRTSLSEAIGHALNDLGVDVVTHVPGYGATEAFEGYNHVKMKRTYISFNEEVAYTVAHGASIAGKRSAVLIKSHGLMKAANSIIDSMYTNNAAGLVVFLFEDKTGEHSDNILDMQPILKGMSLPHKIASNNIYNDIIACYHESESRKLPVVLLVDSVAHTKETEFEQNTSLKKNFNYIKDPLVHAVLPYFADYQYKLFTAKKLEGDIAVISRPKLPMFPFQLPNHIKQAASKYVPFFDAFREFRGDIVTGDTSVSSSFTLPPYELIDIITYMGGSIPLAIGAYLAGFKNVWAITGDFSFISAGQLGLIEAMGREVPIKIVLLNNKEAAATGGQLINKKTMLRSIAGYEQNISHIHDLTNPFDIIEVLKEASTSDQLKIILVDV